MAVGLAPRVPAVRLGLLALFVVALFGFYSLLPFSIISASPGLSHTSAPTTSTTLTTTSEATATATETAATATTTATTMMGLPAGGKARVPLVFVSATSDNHVCSARKLLDSIRRFDAPVPVIFYDLGLSAASIAQLAGVPGVEIRAFPFAEFPAHFSDLKTYAFKPAIVYKVLRDEADSLLWLDAGDRLMGSVAGAVGPSTSARGFYSRSSSGNVRTWTHAGMLKFYNATDDGWLLAQTNCNAAVMAFDRERALEKLVTPWYQCALNPLCIAPPGSDRGNHRQDQASITILAYRLFPTEGPCYGFSHLDGHVQIHTDTDCPQ